MIDFSKELFINGFIPKTLRNGFPKRLLLILMHRLTVSAPHPIER